MLAVCKYAWSESVGLTSERGYAANYFMERDNEWGEYLSCLVSLT